MTTQTRVSSRGIARIVDECLQTTSPIFQNGGSSPGAATRQSGKSITNEPSGIGGVLELPTGAGDNTSSLRYTSLAFHPKAQQMIEIETIVALDSIANIAFFHGFVGRSVSGDDHRDLYSVASNAITLAEADIAGIVFDTDFTNKGGEFLYIVGGGKAGTQVVRSGIVPVADRLYGLKAVVFNSGQVRFTINERGNPRGEPYQLADAVDPDEDFAIYDLATVHSAAAQSAFYKRHTLMYKN